MTALQKTSAVLWALEPRYRTDYEAAFSTDFRKYSPPEEGVPVRPKELWILFRTPDGRGRHAIPYRFVSQRRVCGRGSPNTFEFDFQTMQFATDYRGFEHYYAGPTNSAYLVESPKGLLVFVASPSPPIGIRESIVQAVCGIRFPGPQVF
jgi:hypothetical protein